MIIGFFLLAVLFFAAGFYLARRLLGCFFPGQKRWVSWVVGALLGLLPLLGFARGQLPALLGSISVYWMGIFVYLLLFFLLGDLVLLVLRLCRRKPSARQRTIAGVTALVLALSVSCYGFVHATQLQQTRYTVTVDKPLAEPVHIVLLSDLHLGAEGAEARLPGLVEQVNALQPDLICIAGDLFDSDFAAVRQPEQVQAQLKSLESTYGVYACLGNHDAGSTTDEMLQFLHSSQITVLNDACQVIGDRLLLVGRLDGSPIGGHGSLPDRAPLSQVLAGSDTALPVVVMDHNPAHIDEYSLPVDLVLSGHTHQGQLFPANLVTGLLYASDYGHYRQSPDSTQLIVTSGAGTWGMPMRVGTDCEIVSVFLTN